MSDTPPAPSAATPYNRSLGRKHAARLAAVQCVYARLVDPAARTPALIDWQLHQQTEEAEEPWLPLPPDPKLLRGLSIGVDENEAALRSHLERILTDRWTGKRMPLPMRAILLCALYELLYLPSTSPAIVVDQYVGAADAFLDDSDVRFVHGVLGEIVRDVRPEHAREVPPAPAQEQEDKTTPETDA